MSPSNAEVQRRVVATNIDGIRPKAFRRLIILDNLLQYDYANRGPLRETVWDRASDEMSNFANYAAYLDFVQVSDLDDLDWAIDEVMGESEGGTEDQRSWVTGFTEMSDRTREDYIKTLRAVYEV